MSASISAEQIQKMITGNSTEQYIGGAGGHSPILDLVNRLSGQLNQQTAESNLYRGGAGYGGSFQSADQKAARAAGTTLNAKPYGGWGGYGSQNPIMTTQPPGGDGTDTYVPPWQGGNTTPPEVPVEDPGGQIPIDDPSVPPVTVPPRVPGTTPIPPRTVPGTTPPTPAPPRVPGTTPPVAAPPRVPGTTPVPPRAAPGTSPLVLSAVPSMEPSTSTIEDPYASFAGDGGAVPTTWGGNLKPGDPGWNPAWEGGGPSGGFGQPSGGPAMTTAPYTAPSVVAAQPTAATNATATTPGLQQYSDPNVQKIYEALVRDGMEPSAAMQTDSISNMIAQGASPELIYSNYKAVLQQLGPKAFSMAHGQAGALNGSVEDLSSGQWLRGAITNMTGTDPGASPVKPATMTPANKAGLAAQPDKGGAAITAVPTTPLNDKGGAETPVTTGGGLSTGDPFYVPPPGTPGNTDTGPRSVTMKVPSGGKNWGPRDTPPQGMKWGDYYEAGNGLRVVLTPEGRYAPVNIDADGKMSYSYYTDPDNNSIVPVLNTPDPGARPVIGGKAIVGYTMDGQPIYNEDGMFEQGANADGIGDTTPDAWSTSPDWRPEEPTGGLYGAYTQMAGGQLTDYENAIGQKWRDLSENPATADDTDYKNLVAEYNKTPGKGIDEAYGAYNDMINSNGYSDAEKGAMEGSAVRGISTGFQRGADEIRRQGARTNNRASAYAALGNAGAAYGADLGETNRQNQIKFADEAQRRKEAGASGMTNVAGLSNTRAQFGIGAAGEYAKEMARRREAGIAGMGDFATYGRGLQSQGLAGLDKMLTQSNSDKNNTYAQIAALLSTNVGQSSGGTSKTNTTNIQAGI